MNEQEVMRQPFDIDTHKRTFINYLEVVILPDGTVVYAVPSHQEKLISLCCEKGHMTREELYAIIPEEFYLDMFKWLTAYCGSIAVWNTFYAGLANDAQVKTLRELASSGLYSGFVP